jgi:F-type H+-transporting ATPase subunit epsilon
MAEPRKQLPGPAGLATSLDVNLVTPRGVVAHEDTDGLTAPGEQGEFELLPGHVPYLTALKPGVLTIGDRSKVRYAVSSGYLRVGPQGDVEVLVEQAVLGSEVDVASVQAELKTAEAAVAAWGDKPTDGDWKNLMHRVEWAQARIDASA